MALEGDNMLSILKWAVIAGLVGGVPTGQHFLSTAPAIKAEAETVAAAEIIGDALEACYERLDKCYATCK